MNLITLERNRREAGEPIQAARAFLGEGQAVALATVVSTYGSAPVPVGGQLAIAAEGRFEGSVSGGCVEAEVIAEAAEVIEGGKPKLLEFGVADETAWRVGLPCGGNIKILIERIAGKPGTDHLDTLIAARRDRVKLGVLTSVATGERRIVRSAYELPTELAESFEAGESRLVELGDGLAFLHMHVPVVRVVVAGATHIGQVLARLANELGYDVAVVDPRSAFASEQRFSGTAVLADWPEAGFAALGLDERTAVVALTHTAQIDDEALAQALRSNCLYIGALGSRRSHAKRLERLTALGFGEAELARIHAPVGLPIGAKGPAEIALSILAEIVQVARGAGSP